MLMGARAVVALCWAAFFYPFFFRAPHFQKRGSIVAAGPSRLGILLEAIAIFMALDLHREVAPGLERVAPAIVLGCLADWLAFTAVRHLGRQFRVQAGIWDDHELIRTGPYSIVRHPIYAGLLALLVATLLVMMTPWIWWPVALIVYVAGTEIRIRTEEKLLRSRFGKTFDEYQSSVPAYLPGVR